ncbi:MAG: spore cortex biosynthesis protein YabQ [Clostridia bacterium]
MEVSVTNQAYIFLSSIVGGLIIGLVFDIFRILRRVIKTVNFITYIQDILFWIIVTMIIFLLVFVTNDGELRWYEFLGVVLGIIFYNLLFSTYVIKISVTIINFIKKSILLILKVLLFPFAIIYKIFRKPCLWIGSKVKKGFRKTGNAVRNIFKNIIRTLKILEIRIKKV